MGDRLKMTTKLLHEPLVHFLLLGALLFLIFGLSGGGGDERPDRIVVTAETVDRLAALWTRTWQRPPTEAELKGIIDDHVKEEVFYREALALGLDRNDIVIRRRLRQKMEFFGDDVGDSVEPTEDELRQYLLDHADDFRTPARVAFDQIYIDRDRRGEETTAGSPTVPWPMIVVLAAVGVAVIVAAIRRAPMPGTCSPGSARTIRAVSRRCPAIRCRCRTHST